MSSMAKAARAAMKAKAARMGGKGDPKSKVDSSSWTPPEMMNTEAKTGMRPLTRRAFKKGGKVVGKCEGGPAKIRADRMKRKTGGRSLVTDLINRNDKKANLAREGGDAHTGGLKRGGRAHKLYGGTFVEKGKAGTPMPYGMKHGGRRKRADGGPLYDVSGSSEIYTRDQSTNNAAADLARISRSRARAEDNPSYNPGNAGPAYTPGNYSEMDFNAARDAARAKFEAGNGPSTFAWKGREYGFDATGPARAPRAAAPAPRRQGPMGTLERSQFMDANAEPQSEPPMRGPMGTLERSQFMDANAEPGRYLPPAQVPGVSSEGGGLPRPVPPGGGGMLDYGGLPHPARPGGGMTGQGGLPSPARPSGGGLLGYGGLPSTRRNVAPPPTRENVGFVPESLSGGFTGLGYKRGGSVSDAAQDKKMIKKALRQHDKNMHGGKHEEIKLKKGGYAKRQTGGPTPDPSKAIPGDAPTRGYTPGASATGNNRETVTINRPSSSTIDIRKPEPTTVNRPTRKDGGGTYYGGTRPTGGRMPKAKGGASDDKPNLRLVKTHMGDNGHVTKVYKDKDWGEYRVKHFVNGASQGDYHTDDLDDAHNTAQEMMRQKRARGGRAKGKTNIIIAINPQQDGQQGPMPQMGPTPRPAAPMPVAPPGMPGGAPMPGMPQGAGGLPGMPPGMPGMPPGMPPMPRKSGGRAYRSYKDMDAGAMSGFGRLEKTEIQKRKR